MQPPQPASTGHTSAHSKGVEIWVHGRQSEGREALVCGKHLICSCCCTEGERGLGQPLSIAGELRSLDADCWCAEWA